MTDKPHPYVSNDGIKYAFTALAITLADKFIREKLGRGRAIRHQDALTLAYIERLELLHRKLESAKGGCNHLVPHRLRQLAEVVDENYQARRVKKKLWLDSLYRKDIAPATDAVGEMPRRGDLPTDQFCAAKARATGIDVIHFDPLIRQVVTLLNNVPWLATVWSCQGHRRKNGCGKADVHVVVAEGHLDKLNALWLGYLSRVKHPHCPKLKLWSSAMTFVEGVSFTPMWVMDFGYRIADAEAERVLVSALRSVLVEMGEILEE